MSSIRFRPFAITASSCDSTTKLLVGMRALSLLCLLTTTSALRLAPRPSGTQRSTAQSVDRRTFLLVAASSSLALPPQPASASENSIFYPPASSLAGSTVLITGANTGLGLESAKRLAAAGANVVLTARSAAKAERAVTAVSSLSQPGARVVGLELDLADLASIKSFPSRLTAALGPDASLDVLLNNAGVMAIPERLETADGFERTIGVNHLGHFALVSALVPFLKRAQDGFRIVNVSSDAHRFASPAAMKEAIQADLDPKYSAWGNYAVSKAANVMFTLELQSRIAAAGLKGSAVALHPGVVQTDLSRYIVGGVAAEDQRLSETAPPPTGLGGCLLVLILTALLSAPRVNLC